VGMMCFLEGQVKGKAKVAPVVGTPEVEDNAPRKEKVSQEKLTGGVIIEWGKIQEERKNIPWGEHPIASNLTIKPGRGSGSCRLGTKIKKGLGERGYSRQIGLREVCERDARGTCEKN